MKTLTQINYPKQTYWQSDVAASQNPTEIAIVDSAIPDFESLHQGIKPSIATYSLDSQTDGAAQITKILGKHANIQTLHIISHGSPGTLYLGSTELNRSNIENYRQQLQQWRRALSDRANIILYGCNAASGEAGRQFLTQLHQLTGANIAANEGPTGNRVLGGTWDIPQLIPPSPDKPKLALTKTALKTYSGVLSFATQVTFATGTYPSSVSIGDFNGDGKPDLAVPNRDSTASILLNTTTTGAATPTFATQVTFTAGTTPLSTSIGDFNGDGKPDLAVANDFSNDASILLNTTTTGATTPTFATQVTFATGDRPFFVSIGDINGDGKPDLAVANGNSDDASILLNTTTTGATTPTFATQVTFATGTAPLSVSIGDINGDGKPDLAVANGNSNTASILLNTTTAGATTPTFATQVTFATGDGPQSVSIGDINGDGKPDLAVANYSSNTASILLNTTTTGATTPTFATQITFATGNNPRSVSIGDFNGDGKPDLAVANTRSNNASILLNTTTPVTPTPTPVTPTPTPVTPTPTPVTPTPTPVTPTPTPVTPTPTPVTPTPTPVTPTPTPVTPTPTPVTPTPTPTPVTPTPTPTPTNTPTPTPTQTNTPTNTPTPTPSSIAPPTLLPTGELQITIATPKPSVSSNVRSGLPENTRLGDVYLLTDGNDTSFPAAASGLTVFALSGNDSLTGLDFPNTYFGNQGEDTLLGEGGNDELFGGKGSDSIAGGIGNDFLSGNNDNDILLGGEGDDILRGGKGDDILSGGAGNDVLNGNEGFDILTGGEGGDRFVLQDPITQLSQADLIRDFTASDRIQLIDVTFSQLTFESVSVVLDGATAVTSTAIKSGNNYLGVVYNVNPTALNSSSFL